MPDLAPVLAPDSSLTELTDEYTRRNPQSDRRQISLILERVRGITNNQVGVIELAGELDIETVTEIFIRVNSAGAQLSQADFAMSKIAANETYGGNMLRKAIDYFCHLAVAPDFFSRIEENDKNFSTSEFLPKMRWLKDANDDFYAPSYTDMLRVAFTSEFRRGKLQDLVALLSGRNFETRQYEESIAEESFRLLKNGITNFMNQTHFERLAMILNSAGFVTSKLTGSRNAINFAYIIYLCGRAEGMPAADIERLVQRWYVMSVLRGRYSASPESTFDQDIRGIDEKGLAAYANAVIAAEISSDYWSTLLPQEMETSSRKSPSFLVYQAAQAKLGDLGFLSKGINVRDLLQFRGDAHHIYPSSYLKKQRLSRGRYNQIANLAITQSEINIGIGDAAPENYFGALAKQCNGGVQKYGGITDIDEIRANMSMNCIPESLLDGDIPEYDEFLKQRRVLMAQKIKTYFESL